MHPNQKVYNQRWKTNHPNHFKEMRRKQYLWIQASKHFRRIGIYDEYTENRGVRIY
jgi:hypothetical protein